MARTKHVARRGPKIAASLVLLALAGVACTGDKTPEGRVLGVKFTPAPALPTIEASVPPVVPTVPTPAPAVVTSTPPAASGPAAAVVKPSVNSKPKTSATALYDIHVTCIKSGKRASGVATTGGAKEVRSRVEKGMNLTYNMTYQRDDSAQDPETQSTHSCTIVSKRASAGNEPRFHITLACESEATYTSNPRPLSGVSKSWRSAGELTGGYTHTLTGPKSAEHMSETVRCTVQTVAR